MSETDSAATSDPHLASRDAWVERVLGVEIASAAASGGPATNIRAALLRAARGVKLPEDDAELPGVLAALAPAFLAALLDAPETSAQALGVGAPVPVQDQMTDVAGRLDLLGRKLEEWSAALDDAEAAKTWLGGPGATAAPEDRATTAASYNDDRERGVAIEAEVAAMAQTIRAACAGVSASVGEGAP
jgi:hypothetical protein